MSSPAAWLALILAVADVPIAPVDDPPFVQVFIDDSLTALEGDDIAIPYNASQIRFLLTPVPGIVRYRLERDTGSSDGNDIMFLGANPERRNKGWQQRDGAMFIGVRFYDGNDDFIAERKFLANGRSPGWGGSLDTSAFSLREEIIETPPESRLAEIFISSAGPPASVGVFAVANCDLHEGGVALGFQRGWKKGGTRPSMATNREVEGRSTLVIEDTAIDSHVDWISERKSVRPGESLILRWEEIYSNGMGDPMTALFGTLPAGRYHFIAEEVDLSGRANRHESIDIHVLPPFWRTVWFWGSCLAATAILGAGAGLIWSRAAARQREERVHLIEEERRRIARDLHDDLGARLSQIILASSYSASSAPDEHSQQGFRSITQLAHDVSASLSNTIWLLNPRNDNLESLAEFLNRTLDSLCRSSGVRSRANILEIPEDVPVTSEFRHNVSLAVREAITNALRHANATEIWLHATTRSGRLLIDIVDNGRGIGRNRPLGNGLPNMKQRAEELQGTLAIEPVTPTGTRVHFEFPVPLLPVRSISPLVP